MTQTAYPAHHRWSPEPKQYKNKHIFPPRQCQVNLAVASNLLHFFILHNLQPGSRAKHCIPLYPFCFGEQPVRAFRWMGGWQAIKDSINGFQALIIQQLICFRESLQAKSPRENSSPRAKASISHALKSTHFQAANPLNFPSKTTTSCGFILHFSPKPQFGI